MDINKTFSTVSRRLSSIIRYNNTPRIKEENVAEHSFYVAFYVMILSDFVQGIDKHKAVLLALVHDIEESISGDIPHNVKLKYPDLNDSLERMNYLIASEIFGSRHSKYLDLWKETRIHDTLESKLVDLADKLSVYLYSSDEVSMGNSFMCKIKNDVLKNLEKILCNTPEFSEIKKVLKL